MDTYKRFLKWLLVANIVFIFAVAGIGYQNERAQNKITQVSVQSAAQKNVSHGSTERKVIPVGKTVGIYVNTKGILVIDTGEVTDMGGNTAAPAKNKLMPGDYIMKLNNKTVRTKKQLINAITNCEGKTLVFQVLRGDDTIEVKVEPIESGVDTYKVGIWVRDDLQGLGTVTYVEGHSFGALGHSINDTDTGELLKVSGGEIYEADIFGLEKGQAGKPGIIEGMIAYRTENVVGNIEGNRLYGIYGEITDSFYDSLCTQKPIPIGFMEEVTEGKAAVWSYVSGEKKEYEIEIVGIHKNENGDPEMEIVVKDQELLNLTGGIIQGMSGSPIIQNGKLVGAVTHVFVDDPKRGYGIFIDKMINP